MYKFSLLSMKLPKAITQKNKTKQISTPVSYYFSSIFIQQQNKSWFVIGRKLHWHYPVWHFPVFWRLSSLLFYFLIIFSYWINHNVLQSWSFLLSVVKSNKHQTKLLWRLRKYHMAKSVWTTSWVKVTLGNCEIQVQKTWKSNSVVEKQLSMYKTSGWIPSVKHKYIKSSIQQFKTKSKVKNCFILLTSQTNFTSHINIFSGVVLITFSQEEYLMQSKLGMEEKESIVSFLVYHFWKAFWSKHWTIGVVPMFLLASCFFPPVYLVWDFSVIEIHVFYKCRVITLAKDCWGWNFFLRFIFILNHQRIAANYTNTRNLSVFKYKKADNINDVNGNTG